MMYGKAPFVYDGELLCCLRPVLSAEFFDANNRVEFKFLGKTDVTYHNPARLDTYDARCKIVKIALSLPDGKTETINGDLIRGARAERVRALKYAKIDVYFDAAQLKGQK
jgi:hypothetical protein